MATKKKPRYGSRVEILAAREEIQSLLKAGYSFVMIFDVLKAKRKVSVSYRQFCRAIVQYCGAPTRGKVTPKEEQPAPKKTLPPVQLGSKGKQPVPYITGESDEFVYKKLSDEEMYG